MSKSNRKTNKPDALSFQGQPKGRFSGFIAKINQLLEPAPARNLSDRPRFGRIGLGTLICILGFLVPFALTGLAILVRAIAYERGSAVFSLLYSDAYYQYFPFFVDFRQSILSGEGLQYSWNMGMGTDYIGLYAYYLGSPLNWLTLLIPENWMLDFYTFLVPVRLGFAGLFFSIFLKKTFQRNDFSIVLFATFYATCAWAAGYLWNVMWLDTFALLPLVVLGTIKVLNERKFILYTISLTFAIAINYYIGFFVCIFTLLVFICYEICRWKGFKKFFADLGLMALFSILAIGITAIITLPAYISLQATSSAVNKFPDLNTLFIAKEQTLKGFLEAFVKVATNAYADIEPNSKDAATKGGLPNLYCGVFCIVFAVLYLTTKQVKWRDRICAVGMLVLLNCSFIFAFLDYIWHGFHFTNEIPNRFSFLYSFVMLYMAYRAWTLRRHIRLWQVIAAAVAAFGGMFLSPGFTAFREAIAADSINYITQAFTFPFLNAGFIGLYLVCIAIIAIRSRRKANGSWKAKQGWYRRRKLFRALGSVAMVCVICMELFINICFFGLNLNVQNLAGYPRGGEDAAQMIQFAKDREEENSFYRMEVAQHQTYNDGALNGYYGITTFTSSANEGVTNFLRAMGLSGYKTYNRIAYYDTSPISHLFLNLKYILERQNYVEDNPYLTDVNSSGKVHLMENNYYLPVGFMVDPGLKDIFLDANGEITGTGTFAGQNDLLSKALGQEVTAFTVLDNDQLSISANADVTLSDQNGTFCKYKSATKQGRVFYNFTMDQRGLLCLRLGMPGKNKFTVSYRAADSENFTTLHSDTHNGLEYISTVCQVYPGDEVQVTVECKANESKSLDLIGAVLDSRVMEDAYRQLSQSVLNVTKFDTTVIEGTVDCKESGLMYTSIPQVNGNWHVYVDGEEAEVTLIGKVMVGVMLEEGSHEITFRYQNKALYLGTGISIGCGLIFVCIIAFIYILHKKAKGKYSKEIS